jgi:hypothetical protein
MKKNKVFLHHLNPEYMKRLSMDIHDHWLNILNISNEICWFSIYNFINTNGIKCCYFVNVSSGPGFNKLYKMIDDGTCSVSYEIKKTIHCGYRRIVIKILIIICINPSCTLFFRKVFSERWLFV